RRPDRRPGRRPLDGLLRRRPGPGPALLRGPSRDRGGAAARGVRRGRRARPFARRNHSLPDESAMNRAAPIFLVPLRLAIRWPFFTEGVQKIISVKTGETTTNRPFSSAGYFREAPGPAGSVMRSTVLGDPDDEALALLTVVVPPGDSASLPPHKSMPPEL